MGKKDDPWGHAPSPQLDAVIERLSALTVPQLAVEVMTTGFSSNYDPSDTGSDAQGISYEFCPTPKPHVSFLKVLFVIATCGMGAYVGMGRRAAQEQDPTSNRSKYNRLADLIGEGLQALEKASLLETKTSFDGVATQVGYVTTRLGRDALEKNAVDRVLAGGTL